MTDVIQNARAMLALFARSAWRDVHVRTTDSEMFIAKPDGAANPMARPSASVAPAVVTTTIRSPHIASVVSVMAAGTTIRAGGAVAVIELLGEAIEVVAVEGGTIVSADAAPGDLIEFDRPLATLAA